MIFYKSLVQRVLLVFRAQFPFYGVTFPADFPFFVSKICFPGRIAPGLPVFHGAFLSFPLLQAEKRPCIGFSRPYTYKTPAACADLAAEGVILGQYSCRKSAEGAPCVFLSTQRQRDCRAGLLGACSPLPCLCCHCFVDRLLTGFCQIHNKRLSAVGLCACRNKGPAVPDRLPLPPRAGKFLFSRGRPLRSRLIKLCENSNRGAGSAAHCPCWAQ